jgi:hypothetical protein
MRCAGSHRVSDEAAASTRSAWILPQHMPSTGALLLLWSEAGGWLQRLRTA